MPPSVGVVQCDLTKPNVRLVQAQQFRGVEIRRALSRYGKLAGPPARISFADFARICRVGL